MQRRPYLIPWVTMSIFSALTGGGLRSPQNIRVNGKTLAEILAAHALFVSGKDGGVRAELAGADLTRADLFKAKLACADLRKADLTETNLSGADLTEAQAGGAEFFRASLRQAILRRADFGAANFRDADVQGADFEGAILKTAILRETKLDGVDLSRAEGLATALMPRGYTAPGAANS